MDISSFEILEKKINQALEVLKQQKGSEGDSVLVLTRSQIERITSKLAEITEWIEHAEV
ncbi:MAG: hypothetical protein WC372_03365 [Candidatus Neomarinimicrobiota bacterium]|jgi:uncharacterized protein YicC (UPF0701 family)|nr:hypothetical protein [Candidatus Neomarinimicrobiota bacterium]MDX9779454.1 hypothetical protein [bacterium]